MRYQKIRELRFVMQRIYIYINVLGGSMICAASAICEI